MEKTITLFIILILNSSFLINVTPAQWEPDVRLTNDPADSYTSINNAWCVASSGDTVNVVWGDNRDGNYEIYYKRSTDNGLNWGIDKRLTNNVSGSGEPSIAVFQSVVHIIWSDERDGNSEIYYKRSTDGGSSWGTDKRLTNNLSTSLFPSVAVSGSTVHIVWRDDRDSNNEIYYKRSTDWGINWESDTRLTNNPAESWLPSIAVSGLIVHVVWFDTRDSNEEIYYKRSTDGGLTWGQDTRLTNNAASSECPSISVSGSIVHVVWQDWRDGNPEIYYKRSTNGGTNWGADTRLTTNFYESRYPSVSVSGSVMHVIWEDNRDGNYEIYYKRSTNGGMDWGTDTRLTNNAASSESPSISVSDSAVYVVWYDFRDGNYEIYFKRNPTGNLITEINKISSEIFENYRLYQNYPNPFNPVTTIRYSLPRAGEVKLTIFDALGREVQTLLNEKQQAGVYEAVFDASIYPSGVYFYRLNSGSFTDTKKLLLIK